MRIKRQTAFVSTWVTDDSGVVHIPLSEGHEALIDVGDRDLVSSFRWHLRKSVRKKIKFYVEAKVPARFQWLYGRHTSLHRVVMGLPELTVDHQNGDGLDCRRINLRVATFSQNASNRHYRNKTGFRGVIYKNGKYVAQLCHHGVNRHYGWYDDAKDAAIRYNEEAARIFGEFAILNEVA